MISADGTNRPIRNIRSSSAVGGRSGLDVLSLSSSGPDPTADILEWAGGGECDRPSDVEQTRLHQLKASIRLSILPVDFTEPPSRAGCDHQPCRSRRKYRSPCRSKLSV